MWVTASGGWGRRPEGDAPRSEAVAPGARRLMPARPQPPIFCHPLRGDFEPCPRLQAQLCGGRSGPAFGRCRRSGSKLRVAGVDARRATPPDPRLERWGLAGCRQLDPSHTGLLTCKAADVEPYVDRGSRLGPSFAFAFRLGRRLASLSSGRSSGRFGSRLRSVGLGTRSRPVRGIPRPLIGARRHPSLRLGGGLRTPHGFATGMLSFAPLSFAAVGGAGMGAGLSLMFRSMSDRGARARLVRGVVRGDWRVR